MFSKSKLPPRLSRWSDAYRWENLGEYYKRLHGNETARVLDTVFLNPEYDSETRESILSSTKANDSQRRFLANVLDIDWLVIDNGGRPGLVEEKSVDITGKQFNRGNVIYIDHGTRLWLLRRRSHGSSHGK